MKRLTKIFMLVVAVIMCFTTLAACDNSNGGTNLQTITFDANKPAGVTLDVSNMPANQNIEKGGKITEPMDPVLVGYDFDGWYKEAACINKVDFAIYTVTGNVIFYAKWDEIAAPADYRTQLETALRKTLDELTGLTFSEMEASNIVIRALFDESGNTAAISLWDDNAAAMYPDKDSLLHLHWGTRADTILTNKIYIYGTEDYYEIEVESLTYNEAENTFIIIISYDDSPSLLIDKARMELHYTLENGYVREVKIADLNFQFPEDESTRFDFYLTFYVTPNPFQIATVTNNAKWNTVISNTITAFDYTNLDTSYSFRMISESVRIDNDILIAGTDRINMSFDGNKTERLLIYGTESGYFVDSDRTFHIIDNGKAYDYNANEIGYFVTESDFVLGNNEAAMYRTILPDQNFCEMPIGFLIDKFDWFSFQDGKYVLEQDKFEDMGLYFSSQGVPSANQDIVEMYYTIENNKISGFFLWTEKGGEYLKLSYSFDRYGTTTVTLPKYYEYYDLPDEYAGTIWAADVPVDFWQELSNTLDYMTFQNDSIEIYIKGNPVADAYDYELVWCTEYNRIELFIFLYEDERSGFFAHPDMADIWFMEFDLECTSNPEISKLRFVFMELE